jgi:type IV fimbrial biogenesis protein FimT
MYNQKGFTIMELIVVVGVIAIVSGILIPVYFSMKPTIRINGAARQIQGDFMWAKMRAVSENNDYVIVFGSAGSDLSNDTYYIYDDNDSDYSTNGTETGELVKTVVISDEYKDVGYGYVTGINKTDNVTPFLVGDAAVTFNPSAGFIWFRFEPNGRSNKNGGIYLILDEDKINGIKDRSRAITVLQTGRVKVFDYSAASNQWE